MFHFHIGEHCIQITDTLLYLFKKVCFTSFPQTPFCFSSYRSKIQIHSRCADHISQLDTLTATLEFFFSSTHCLHCFKCPQVEIKKYYSPLDTQLYVCDPDINVDRYLHSIQTGIAMDAGYSSFKLSM